MPSRTRDREKYRQHGLSLPVRHTPGNAGQFEEAIAEVKLAEKIDPSGPATILDMLQIYY